jgi:hypothetical protein
MMKLLRVDGSRSSLFILIAAVVLLVVSGAAMFWQTHGEIKPLLTGDRQFTNDDFVEYKLDPRVTFLPPSVIDKITIKENIKRMPDGSFPSSAGRVETQPFTPSRFVGIPVKGADVNQINLYKTKSRVTLQCIESNAAIDLLGGQTEYFYLATTRVPDGWCKGPVKAVAESKMDSLHVGVGTPVRISAVQWVLSRTGGALVALAFVFAMGILVTIPFVAMPKCTLGIRVTMVAAYPTVCGYAAFMAGWYSGAQPVVVGVAALLFITVPSAIWLRCVRGDSRSGANDQDARWFLAALFAVCLLIATPYILLSSNGGGYWFSAYAFFPASWSTDNILSMQTARSVLLAGKVHPEALGVWRLSDRGVIQPGTLLALFGLPGIGRVIMEWPVGIYAQAMFTGLIQGLVVPIGFLFLRKNEKHWLDSILMGLTLCTTPFIMFNTVYAWPKLSGGILAFMSLLWFAASLKKGNARGLSLSVLLFAMGALNHSATLLMIFAFPSYLLIGSVFRVLDWGNIRKAAFGAPYLLGLTVLVSIGSLAWVDLIESKSSFTITYLLTGDGRHGLTRPEVWNQIFAYYQSLTFDRFVHEKVTNLRGLFWTTNSFYARDNGIPWSLASIRAQEFCSLIPAMGPGVILAATVAAVGGNRRRGDSGVSKPDDINVYILGVSCAIALVVIILVCGMLTTTHQLPYGVILGLLFTLMYLYRGNRSAMLLGAVLQVLNVGIVWYWGSMRLWAELASKAL